MKKHILFIFLGLFLFSNIGMTMSQKERIDDAQTIIDLFAQQYGPLKWKEENLGIDFNEMSNRFLSEAANVNSDLDFYNAVAMFLAEFKDAHISYEIPSSQYSYLPFNTDYFEDGVVITYINRNELPKEKFPFEIGDRLKAMDGVPINDVIRSLIPYQENGYERTNMKYIGSQLLTFRHQSAFPYIPKGPVTLTISPAKKSSEQNVTVEWVVRGYELAEMPPKSATSYMAKAMTSGAQNKPETADGDLIDQLRHSSYVDRRGDPNNSDSLGSIRPFFSLWENFRPRMTDPYLTGTFEYNDKTIGYIRINTWMANENDPMILDLQREIEFMNSNTDALVIDQTNNGGGNPCYMYRIASFFITGPMPEMRKQVRANRTWLSDFENWFEYSAGDEKIHARSWLNALRTAVLNGDHLSSPLPICEITGEIFPYRNDNEIITVYIKPVLVLINELDFSASDGFASIVKDWGMAKLFGSRTAGAGGNVNGVQFIGNSELSIRLTRSLMYRSSENLSENGIMSHYVENVGVTPDIPYELSLKDYYDGYKGYRDAIGRAVLGLLNNQ